MEKFSITGPDDEVQRWKEEAEELGITQSRYGRERVRAGRRLWSAGEFQVDNLGQLLNGEDQTGKSASPSGDKSLATVEQDLTETILRELPRSGAREPVELPELRQLVFGTKEEQEEAILDALEKLGEQDRAERTMKGGYVKTADNDE